MSNRSGTAYSAPTDADRRPVMLGVSTADGITPTPLEVNPVTGELLVNAAVTTVGGSVSTVNSTTTPLTAGSTFTGTGVSVLNYSVVEVYVYSDQSSAANGLYIEYSSDNTNWNDASPFTFTATGSAPNNGQVFAAAVRGQYMRVVYTNGGTNQTTFRLQTVLKSNIVGGDVLSINGTLNDNNHGLLSISQIVGKTTGGGGGYIPVKVNPSGTLTVDATGSTGLLVGTTSAPVNVGQQTSNTTAVQLSSVSTVPTNGIIVQALKGNAANVYIGGSSVTTSTGFELQPGQAVSFTCNLNTLYVIGSNNTDKVCWNVL